jgi:DnaK suppressor protein
MASKKPLKAQKKVAKTKTVSKPKSPKKTAARTAKKTKTTPKGIQTSSKMKKTKKLTLKTPVSRTTKKEVRKKPSSKIQAAKVAPKKPARKVQPARVAPKRLATKPAAVMQHVEKKPAPAKKNLGPRERKIQEIKKTLLMQKTELLNEAEEALNALPGQTIFPDMGDQASAEIDRNFMLRLRGREQRLLKKIEQAIEKIDSGAFGTCDICGEEINLKRLEARPVTNMCISCKTEQEEEEKMRGK